MDMSKHEEFFAALMEGRVILQSLYDIEKGEPRGNHVFAEKGAIEYEAALGDLQVIVLPDENYHDPSEVIAEMNEQLRLDAVHNSRKRTKDIKNRLV